MKKLLLTIAILALFAPTVLAADNFSGNHVQGVFGQFVPVLDESVAFSQDNVQGVFGQFVAVLDEAAGAVVAVQTNFLGPVGPGAVMPIEKSASTV